MKFFHLSDLHIGKQLNGYSLKRNQEAVLKQAAEYAIAIRPDAVLICGDIYDKTAPSAEAYTLFNQFLEDLAEIRPAIPVLIIAGNHDSPERLSYASSFLEKHNIFMSVMPPQNPEEYLKKISLKDEFGPVHFYLLPFLKPGYVRNAVDQPAEGYENAVKAILDRESIDKTQRNVLLSHQFYIGKGDGPMVCDSEQAVIMAGGQDSIDASILSDFDYAALGHLHGSQKVLKNTVRYCGTPYKYSVSEEGHNKSITVVTLSEKGEEPELAFLPLKGIQDVRREKGPIKEIISRVTEENRHDFVSVTITDEEEPYHVREQLLETFDYLLEFGIENERTKQRLMENGEDIPVLRPMEAFSQFFQAVGGRKMSQEEEKTIKEVMEEAKEELGL